MKKTVIGIMALTLTASSVIFQNNDNFLNVSATVIESYSENLNYELLTYEICDDGYIRIIACDESAVNVEIPSEIDGLPVTVIGDNAFYKCRSLESVTIPESIKEIQENAFWVCMALKEINIPSSVEKIATDSFYYCTSLEKINVSADNQFFSDIDGVMFNKNQTELLRFPINYYLTEYTVPDTVTAVGDSAFTFCKNTTDITLPNGLEKIGTYSFGFCQNLKNINIPDSVKTIGVDAFSGCENLENVDVSYDKLKDMKIMPQLSFKGTNWFEKFDNGNGVIIDNILFRYVGEYDEVLTIDENIKSLATGCLFSSNIKKCIIPSHITEISAGAFAYSSELKEVVIGDNVKSIKEEAFLGCEDIKSIIIPKNVEEIGEYALGYSGGSRVRSPNCCAKLVYNTSLNEYSDAKFSQTISDALLNSYEKPEEEIPSNIKKYDDFIIYGYTGTVAEKYAEENDFEFIAIDGENVCTGDANCDNDVDIRDVTFLNQYLIGAKEFSTYGIVNADTIKDNTVDIKDLGQLRKYIIGMINEF